MPTPDGSTFGYDDLVVATVDELYRPWQWGPLADLLEQLYAATTSRERTAAVGGLRGTAYRSTAAAPYDNRLEAAYANL